MPKVSEAYLEARRQQVLEAAFAGFARRGFHETTIQDIGCEAGVSYGVVYHYFRNKEDVIEASWQASQQARAARFQIAQQRGNAPEALAEILDVYMKRLEKPESTPERRLRINLFSEALRTPRIRENIRRTWDDVLGNIEQIVRRGQEKGEINPRLDPNALARVYLAIHDGAMLQKTVDPDVDIRPNVEVFEALHRGDLWQSQGKAVDSDGSKEGSQLRPAPEGAVPRDKRVRRRQGR